jgi:hypothetical protein
MKPCSGSSTTLAQSTAEVRYGPLPLFTKEPSHGHINCAILRLLEISRTAIFDTDDVLLFGFNFSNLQTEF